MVSTIIWPLLRLAFFTALIKGGFLWLEQSHQIYVDRWVASMIGAAESMAVQAPSWVGWVLTGLGGFVCLGIWEIVKRLRKIGGHPHAPSGLIPGEPDRLPLTPKLVIQHDKPRDTEPWPGLNGYSVKFRVLNDSEMRAKRVGARIRKLEFLEKGQWRSYGHDYADLPLATRDGRSEFDLQGGDEESVYIARRPTRSGEPVELC